MAENDGTVRIGVEFDVNRDGLNNIGRDAEQSLQGASDAAEELDESVEAAAQSTQELSGALEQTADSVESLGESADNAADNVDNLSGNADNAAENMEQLAQTANTTSEQVEAAGEQARDAGEDMERLSDQARNTEESMDGLNRQTQATEDEMDRFGRQTRETDEDTESLRERIRELETRLEGLETQSNRTRERLSPLEQSARALRDGFRESSESVEKLKSSLQNVGEAAKKALSVIGSAAKTALSISIKGITASAGAMSAIGGYAVSVGKNFESSMSQVAATMGITKDTIVDGVNAYDLLKNAASQAGETTVFSASEAADALNYLALAGYSAEQAADALPVVLDLAAAGGLDLAYASDLATDAMAALGIEANSENLTSFGDQLAKTASTANTSVAQLGEAILTVGGTAKSLSGGTTELNAALGVLANRGIKGSEGGTKLRNMILSLTAPTEDAAQLMNDLGLSVLDAEGNMRPINDIFKDLDSALSGMAQGQKTEVLNAIFNKVDLAAVEGLLAGCGDEFDNLTAAILDSDGAMAQMADTMSDNLEGDLKSLSSKAEAFGNVVYEELEEPLRQLAQKGGQYLTELKESFEEGGFEGLADKFGNVLADVLSMGAEKLPELLGLGSNMLSSVANGILENADVLSESFLNVLLALPDFIMENLGTVLEVGSVFISKISQGISDNAQELSESAVQTVEMFVDFLKENIPLIVQAGKDMIIALADEIEKEVPALKPFTSVVKNLAENLEDVLKVVLPVVAGIKGIQIAKTAAGAITPLIDAFKRAREHAGIFSSILEVMGGKVTVAIAIIGGLAAAIAAVVAMHKEEKTAYEKAYEKEQEYQKEVQENIDKLKELKESSDDAAEAEAIQYGKVEELWNELDKLADSSGKVKDADKERAEYIKNQLEEALGIEIEMVDGQIQRYDELKSSIEDVIKQKKIEAMLDAYRPAYTEALQQQIEANQSYREKRAERDEAIATIADIESKKGTLEWSLLSRMQSAGFTGDTIDANTFIGSGWTDLLDDVGKAQAEAFEKEWSEIQAILDEESAKELYKRGNMSEELYQLSQDYAEAVATKATSIRGIESAEKQFALAASMVQAIDDIDYNLSIGNLDEAEADLYEFLGAEKEVKIDSEEFAEMQKEEQAQILRDSLANAQYDLDLAQKSGLEERIKDAQEAFDNLLIEAHEAGFDIGETFGEEFQTAFNKLMMTGNAYKISSNNLIPLTINSESDAKYAKQRQEEFRDELDQHLQAEKDYINALNQEVEGYTEKGLAELKAETDNLLLEAYANGYNIAVQYGDGFIDRMIEVAGRFQTAARDIVNQAANNLTNFGSRFMTSTSNTTDSHNTNIGQVNVYTDNLDVDEFAETISGKQKLNSRGIGVRT